MLPRQDSPGLAAYRQWERRTLAAKRSPDPWTSALAALDYGTPPQVWCPEQAAWHASWCAVCWETLGAGDAVYRRRVNTWEAGDGFADRTQYVVAPWCSRCAHEATHEWRHLGLCLACDHDVWMFRPGSRYRRPYCSTLCARNDRSTRAKDRRAWRRSRREPLVCAHCGAGFVPARSDARYCSTRCRVAAHRSRRATVAEQPGGV